MNRNRLFSAVIAASLCCMLVNTSYGLTSNKQVDERVKLAKNMNGKKKGKKMSLFGGKNITEMTYVELIDYKNRKLASKDISAAIKGMELALRLCDDLKQISVHMIELADLYFENGDMTKAELLYTEYTHLYPGGDLIEYAFYKAIVCAFNATCDAERDQTKTYETLALTDQFIARADLFKKYYTQVMEIRVQCQHKIVDGEINIFTYFLKRGNFASAQRRLDGLQTDWVEKLPDIKPRLQALQNDLETQKILATPVVTVSKKEKRRKARQEKTLLAQNQHQPVVEAKNLSVEQSENLQVAQQSAAQAKKSFVDRF